MKKKQRKKIPKLYLITSLIISILGLIGFFLRYSSEIFARYFFPVTLGLLLIWAITNFFMFIYFLAKNYEKITYVLSILFFVFLVIYYFGGLVFPITTFSEIMILYYLVIISISLYTLWKENPNSKESKK